MNMRDTNLTPRVGDGWRAIARYPSMDVVNNLAGLGERNRQP